eukprot:TRINITY_DN1280_c0_g2_i1.p1 TRINITY_DN1280_c0_g2~~TRINITY_DN1280_c0_g2_i1.p1  ORF type:complete len:117 (-),score=18.87 TRINITY_DN1280_c0_g2_i1:886-1236(-)
MKLKELTIINSRQSLCWFQPGVECLARIAKWDYLADYQRNIVQSRDWNLKNHLQSLTPPNNNIVTRCFSKETIAQYPCPLGNCTPLKKKDTKRDYCTSFSCSNCQTPDSRFSRLQN